MGFIYTSFLEFVVVNYLARWVLDPESQKRKRDNAILDVSLKYFSAPQVFSILSSSAWQACSS